MVANRIRRRFRNAVERAGLGWYVEDGKGGKRFETDVTPHTIRHTVATWQKGKIQTVFTSAFLGHGDEATTRNIYQHASAETTRPAIDLIDATFAALPTIEEKPKALPERKARKVRAIVNVTIEPKTKASRKG